MPVVLAVIQATPAFARVWGDLLDPEEGVEIRSAPSIGDLAPLGEAAALILSVGGAEETAASRLRELRRRNDAPATAVVTARPDHRLATVLLREGAGEYFALPDDLELLREWVEGRVQHAVARSRAGEMASREARRYDFSRLVGQSPGLRRALDRAARIIPRDRLTVLITGETGTGKELLAQAIHYNGPRKAGPFVEVNCTALPESLLEAELFGFEQGAFTDARSAKPGLFEAAHGGTLLLDEVGDLSIELQVKLLKVLEDKKVRRLGSVKTTPVDVRVVAATHVDLARAVSDGRFREDLYYRLNVVPLHLPPLREREDDVVVLAEHFLDQASREHDLPRPDVTPEIVGALRSHRWPGNVRELRNAVERAVVLGDGVLHADDLFLRSPEPPIAATGLPFPAPLRTIERAAAVEAVRRTDGNKSAAAELLEISRTRLYRLLEEADGAANGEAG